MFGEEKKCYILVPCSTWFNFKTHNVLKRNLTFIIEMKPCGIKYMIAFPSKSFVLLIFTINAVVKWPPELLLLEKSNWQVELASGILDCFSSFLSPVFLFFLVCSCPINLPLHPTQTPKFHIVIMTVDGQGRSWKPKEAPEWGEKNITREDKKVLTKLVTSPPDTQLVAKLQDTVPRRLHQHQCLRTFNITLGTAWLGANFLSLCFVSH